MDCINIGVVTVRDKTYHPNRRLMEAARKAGHHIHLIHPYKIWPGVLKERALFVPAPGLSEFDVVIPRQGAQIKDSSLALIRHMEFCGIPVINGSKTIAITRSQIHTLQILNAHGIPVPDSVFINHLNGALHAVDQVGGWPVVAKQIDGRQGEGVMLFTDEAMLKKKVLKYLDKRKGMVIQRFIKPEGRRDIRVLIIGGRIEGAVELVPSEKDFRSNYHLGGRIRRTSLSGPVERIVLKAASIVDAHVAGVDLMIGESGEPVVVEVNYSPGFKGMEKATGLDIAGKIISYAWDRSRVGTYDER